MYKFDHYQLLMASLKLVCIPSHAKKFGDTFSVAREQMECQCLPMGLLLEKICFSNYIRNSRKSSYGIRTMYNDNNNNVVMLCFEK